jgi:hypothetical protein
MGPLQQPELMILGIPFQTYLTYHRVHDPFKADVESR